MLLFTVNINAEINLMAVDPRNECFSRDLVPEYCQGLDSSVVYTAPPYFVATVPDHSNRSLPRLPLHLHAEAIICTFITSNIYIGLCFPKALTLTQFSLYKIFEVYLIVRINKSVGLLGNLNFRLLREAFPYRLARGIPLKDGVQ